METHILISLISLAGLILEVTALFTVLAAIRDTRTAQGAIAWSVALIAMPIITLPMYWIFGRNKFHGYVDALRAGHEEFLTFNRQEYRPSESLNCHAHMDKSKAVFEHLAGIPFLDGNELKLFVDGNSTFDAVMEDIDKAEQYILVQFFIVHDDGIGNRLKGHLIRKASEGVEIRFLYDEVGCHTTPKTFWDEMRAAGIEVAPFLTTKGKGNRFQLNFRNHRKIVVVDGHTAFVGGHNVGDEYLGLSKEFGPWRDTHLRCVGPAVCGVQISFAEDWFWATHKRLDLQWAPRTRGQGAEVLALGTGPSDQLESCSLMYVRAINSAQERFWVASPYFVPDGSVLSALQLAALRGVDVRLVVPEKPDHKLVWLACFHCLKQLDLPGIRVYRYNQGFMHQKTFLVDDRWAAVGTANMDNRSFRLNFELTMLVDDDDFCKQIEAMFEHDFTHCDETGPNEYDNLSLLKRYAVKVARLFAPIL